MSIVNNIHRGNHNGGEVVRSSALRDFGASSASGDFGVARPAAKSQPAVKSQRFAKSQPAAKSQRFAQHLLHIILDTVLIVVAAFALAVAGAAIYMVATGGQSSIFGYSFEVVTSGSMTPVISTGDLIVVKEEPTYAQGDVVTYKDASGNLITHRIVGVGDDGRYVTKGDANNVADRVAVSKSDIVGELVFVVPGGQAIVNFARQPIVVGALAFVLVLLVLMPLFAGWRSARRRL
jgi:signal peptidase